jgi:hypothetical protein
MTSDRVPTECPCKLTSLPFARFRHDGSFAGREIRIDRWEMARLRLVDVSVMTAVGIVAFCPPGRRHGQ